MPNFERDSETYLTCQWEPRSGAPIAAPSLPRLLLKTMSKKRGKMQMLSNCAEWEENQNSFAYSRPAPLHGSKKVLPLAGVRVLAIDDHDDTNHLFSTALELEGALVKVFNTALSALEVLEQFQPELVICDLAMPLMDGEQFIVEVRTRGWQMPAIAISGRCEQDRIEQALAVGFSLHMCKPVQIRELIKNVIQILAPQGSDTFER